jgi:hypothetical protein
MIRLNKYNVEQTITTYDEERKVTIVYSSGQHRGAFDFGSRNALFYADNRNICVTKILPEQKQT